MPAIGRLLENAAARLSSAGIASHRLDAELLLAHILNVRRAAILARAEASVEDEEAARFEEMVTRRAARVPVAYIVGSKEFWSLDFAVNPAVLIPRPETETVVEEALRALASTASPKPVAVDVGTGAGPIAVSLLHERPDLEVLAIDLSEAALAVARANAERHGVASRIHFHRGDLLAPLLARSSPRVDLVVSNPPYVGLDEPVDPEVAAAEPKEAIFGGREGSEVIERLVPQAAKALAPGGHLVLEISPARERAVRGFLGSGAGALFWTDVKIVPDLAGRARVVSARRTGINA